MPGNRRADGEVHSRNGKLRIPLPFEDALKAATETKAPPQPPKKPRQKKATKKS